jgi:membrane protein
MPDTTPRAILFDVDGTLIDSNDAHVAAWEAAFSEAGYQIPTANIHAQVGKGADNLVPSLLPDATPEQAEALGEAHGRFFKPMLPDLKPFPGAPELLARAHASGARVVLASSASKDELEHHIETLGVRDLLHATTSKDDVESSKPAPDIFAAAVKAAGVPAENAIAVGDTPYDIKAAGGAGIRCVGLLSGGFPADTLGDAVAIYPDAQALLDRFDESPLAA